jgi:hypothetical protein
MLRIDETQVRLVDEGGSLEAVASSLAGHASSRDAVKLALDLRDQPIERLLVARAPCEQEAGHAAGIRHDATL